MNEEEKKAIEQLENYIKEPYSLKIDERTGFTRVNTKFHLPSEKTIQIILNLIEKQDKIIDLMAAEMKSKEYEYEDMCLYSEDCHGEYCEHCIKEYFRKKVEND